jgi:hypothetical protein
MATSESNNSQQEHDALKVGELRPLKELAEEYSLSYHIEIKLV